MTDTPCIVTTFEALLAADAALRSVSAQDGLSAKTKYHVAKLARLAAAYDPTDPDIT